VSLALRIRTEAMHLFHGLLRLIQDPMAASCRPDFGPVPPRGPGSPRCGGTRSAVNTGSTM
jgi:hypothetical protein